MILLMVCNAIDGLTVEETRQLVFKMGVPVKDIDNIGEQNSGGMQLVYLVKKWLDMTPDASWDKLVAGLRKINKNSLAADIESRHHTNATFDSVGPLAPVTATPAPVGPLAPVTATPAPVGPLAPVAAIPALVGPLAPVTATPAPVGPLTPVTATPAPVAPPDNTEQTFEQRVAGAKDGVEHLQEEFFDLKSDTQESLSGEEHRDPKFIQKFQDYLLEMPVAKRQVHIRFFSKNAEKILDAKTIRKLFVILGRYCNYSNYEIILHVVKRFCQELKGRMLTYRDCLISFEKSTTVDVYLCVISASPGGSIMKGFIRMTMKLNKPPSKCSLYEIRELKESIEEEVALESYAMYIETPGEGSVSVSLCIHEEVGWMVGVVFTAEFRQEHLVMEVTVVHSECWRGVQDIIIYLVRNQVVS